MSTTKIKIYTRLVSTNTLTLTLTSTAFIAAVSGLMSTVEGNWTVSSALQNKIASQDTTIKKHKATTLKRKAATSSLGHKLATRTRRVAAKSIAAITAESIPFIGVAVLIADTAYELNTACENGRDLDQLYSDLGMVDEVRGDVMHSVCYPELPSLPVPWS